MSYAGYAADIGQQHLDRHDQRHYIQEAFVLVDVLQQVKTGNTHVKTVATAIKIYVQKKPVYV